MTQSERLDDASLRLSCASNLLTLIAIMLEGKCDEPANSVVSGALHGINMLIEDAENRLH